MEKLLNAQEVADKLALKLATVRRMILERRIATVRPSVRAVRIPESEVRRIIEAGYRPRIETEGGKTDIDIAVVTIRARKAC